MTALRALLAVGLATSPLAAAQEHRSRPDTVKVIVVYRALIDATNAARLTDIIAQNTDKVIGLKLTVEKSKDSDTRYYTSLESGRLNITSGDPTDGPVEVLVNGGLGTTWDMMTVDGFYLIKSGGMHAAGAVSFGAVPVDEATIRLNPTIRIVERQL